MLDCINAALCVQYFRRTHFYTFSFFFVTIDTYEEGAYHGTGDGGEGCHDEDGGDDDQHVDRLEDISALKGVVVTSDVRGAAPSQNHKGRKQL